MYEVTLDGQPHTGSYPTEGEAQRQLAALKDQFPGRKLEVRQRAPQGSADRYVGAQNPDGDPNYVAKALEQQGVSVAGERDPQQGLSQGIVPGPGGAADTGEGKPGGLGGQGQVVEPGQKGNAKK